MKTEIQRQFTILKVTDIFLAKQYSYCQSDQRLVCYNFLSQKLLRAQLDHIWVSMTV